MTDKLDPAEVLRALDREIVGTDAARLIRQMQEAMVDADWWAKRVVDNHAAATASNVTKSLAPFLPKPDPLDELVQDIANELRITGESTLHTVRADDFRAALRLVLARRGGTITWKDGV